MTAPNAAVDITGTLVSSAVVAAIVAGLSSFLTQRYLLQRKAQVDYEFMARKRLNEAIGPLRMQLLFSARDVIGRVRWHAGSRWNMDPSQHFARSFIYRLVRPLAVAELIERQMTVADFSVDPGAIALLRFNRSAERMLSGDDVLLEHPEADWSTQSQHLFRDNLRAAAARLITDEDEAAVVMDYSRFQREVSDPSEDEAFADLARIFTRSEDNLTKNPLFWLRIVGYAYACTRLISNQGVSLGFDDVSLPADEMLGAVDDEIVSSRAPDYVASFDRILAKGL